MYIDDQTYTSHGKTYRRVLLRHSRREGKKKSNITIANLSNYKDNEIEAIKIALAFKDRLTELRALCNTSGEDWKLCGVVLMLYQLSQQEGLYNILGKSNQAMLILWLIFARIIGQGSRLSAVRLAKIHAGCEILGIKRMTEDDLYAALEWLYQNKEEIERKLYLRWKSKNKEGERYVFLYDLSSSYFEGVLNELAFYGYNRDKKKGKKIITYGLLTDQDGYPLGIEAFPGNTTDNKTVKTQIEKLKQLYGADKIVFVGDKGMIKSKEIALICSEGFQYITTISKPQIETMLKNGMFSMSLFDVNISEIYDAENKTRYILRRNPLRALEIQTSRKDKTDAINRKITISNEYLKLHKKATILVQKNKIEDYIEKLKLQMAVKIEESSNNHRALSIIIDNDKLEELGKLDGCYAVKTNLPFDVLSKEVIHSRYKDLAKVEQAFKIDKSELEIRPIYLRKKEKTIAHLEICMLAYLLQRKLKQAWKEFDIKTSEGIETLKEISAKLIENKATGTKQIMINRPNPECKELLQKLKVYIPDVLPYFESDVHTNRKLQNRRK